MARRVRLEWSFTEGKSQDKDEDSLLDFAPFNPSLADLPNNHTESSFVSQSEPPRILCGDKVDDMVHVHRFKGQPGAWQQSETVTEFLRRMPVTDPKTVTLDGWLWVGNPCVRRSQDDHRRGQDLTAFEAGGTTLLEKFEVQQAETERAAHGKAQATITRRLRPLREKLESDLLTLAVKTGVTCGKWMMFPTSNDLPRFWRLVVEATVAGKLGLCSKVATPDPSSRKDETLICVYTYDFSDMEDVRRVLDQLLELGLVQGGGKPIYWKADAYTYLNLSSGNPYNIRASLYSSKDVLQNLAKATTEGPVARLRNRTTPFHGLFS